MSKRTHMQIFEGEEARAYLDDGTLIHLTNRVNKIERDDKAGQICHDTALRLRATLGKGAETDALILQTDRAFYQIEHMKRLRDAGQVAIARDGDKTVGMAGFEWRATDPDTGRNFFELRRIAIRKTHERRGIGSELHRLMLDTVRSVDPNALILTETESPAVIHQCQKMGYKPFSADKAARMNMVHMQMNSFTKTPIRNSFYTTWQTRRNNHGGAGEDRTRAWGICSPLPYCLATAPQSDLLNDLMWWS